DEDVSEAAVAARHVRAEQRERSRYARKPRRRHAPDAPDAQPEPPPTQPEPVPPPPQTPHETVRPYSPRRFPLPDAAYQAMVACMPDGHLPPAPDSPQ
ncbi:atherin-like, partial [Ostrinia furnacalis]